MAKENGDHPAEIPEEFGHVGLLINRPPGSRGSIPRSSANQPLLPLVDQDVGDDGRARRSELATRRMIPGRQFLEFLPARRGSEQRPQFLLSFLEAMLRSHRSSLSKRKREVSFGAD